MNIRTKTTMTQIGEDGRVKPKSPLWQIYNDGNTVLYVNNDLPIQPGDTFGIDVTNLFANKNISEIINETEFDIKFGVYVAIGIHIARKSCQLIETNFKIIN